MMKKDDPDKNKTGPAVAKDRIFNETPGKIAKTVRHHRKKLDLTQKQAAERCGVKRASIGALEEGRLANVSDKKIWKICKGLNIEPATLSRDIKLRSEAAKRLDDLIQSGDIDKDTSSVLLKLFEKAGREEPPSATRSATRPATRPGPRPESEDELGRFGEWALATAPMGRIIIRHSGGDSIEVTKEKMRTIHELDIPITLYNRLKELEAQGYIKREPSPVADRPLMAADARGHYSTETAAQVDFKNLCENIGKIVENPHALRMSYYEDYKAAARKTGASTDDGESTTFETPIRGMNPDDFALINVTGDSMAPLICEGDKVLIERNGEVPENGTIVLADYDGGMIKRFFKEGDNIILKSEN
ncbi:MAG: XRE family transcriptional regulator, partial [bacterium]